ncbi:WG repeat-containing protein [Achromobacter xylosoxidans]
MSAPVFQFIGGFRDGQAAASLGPGKVGVIDLQGKWVVPPRHHDVKRVSDKLWLVQQPGPQENEYRRPTSLVNRDGRALTPFEPGLEARAKPTARSWPITTSSAG